MGKRFENFWEFNWLSARSSYYPLFVIRYYPLLPLFIDLNSWEFNWLGARHLITRYYALLPVITRYYALWGKRFENFWEFNWLSARSSYYPLLRVITFYGGKRFALLRSSYYPLLRYYPLLLVITCYAGKRFENFGNLIG